ncbi:MULTISPECIES: hypothetical protein [Mycolicibacterium]|uniref:Uncharacterized protein n=2 Tax=Mycolicibacterium TaxID=1866885 RepID=A0AAW5SKM6_MYCNV|nr:MULTISPECIES: hypothetical protein [Mycolicibacterium]MCV7024363.1 hypothetical protein [Mycolicibacterium novocastrense]MDG5486348.1 hypothetical protein [Mycolicibacterium gadium]GAT11985.1 putative uncharacterized protein [Mycolicibacterium novocastrense]
MSETAVNSGGLSKLREGRQRRAGQVPPPRHPAAAPATPQDPVSAETTAPAAASPVMSRAAAGAERAAVRDIATPPDRADTEVAAGEGAAQTVGRRPLPDLTIDWSDPVMHVVRATRLSVAGSVFDAFKAAAEQPGQPPQTSLIMAAVSSHLARLPELVLARRPDEHTDFSSFYRRPTVASRNRTDPQVALYIRPNGGEDQALNRIVSWVNAIITDGHPGRREASRSEIVAAALAAEYVPKR